MVALAYATRHPAHPGRLILVSTEAAGHSHLKWRVELFERLGSPDVGALARQRFLEGKLNDAFIAQWLRLAMPVYTRTRRNPLAPQRTIRRAKVDLWFARPGAKDGLSISSPSLHAYNVRRSCSAATMIR